ncbi:Polypeptide N-acetylgalactosaminyltransferase 9 [Varanus komodoensis]|nr:Polypeptide N-acetylgalactosaminyltransferase 9 [Varanus komodoensis]
MVGYFRLHEGKVLFVGTKNNLILVPASVPGGGSWELAFIARCKQMSYPDDLPQISVVFIFVNEALSVILRSVHSVANHTPSHLLKEIILVDDNSDNVELKFNLDQYVHKRYPGLVKIVRNNKREGLIRARIQGWKAATSPVVGFFDAHVEFNTGWVEPALTRIKEDRKRIILPAIDNIKYNTFEVQQYANAAHGYNWGLWCMYIIPPQDWLDKGDEATRAVCGCGGGGCARNITVSLSQDLHGTAGGLMHPSSISCKGGACTCEAAGERKGPFSEETGVQC